MKASTSALNDYSPATPTATSYFFTTGALCFSSFFTATSLIGSALVFAIPTYTHYN
jgi:hypothetical protein